MENLFGTRWKFVRFWYVQNLQVLDNWIYLISGFNDDDKHLFVMHVKQSKSL